jgi:hypothetical protein
MQRANFDDHLRRIPEKMERVCALRVQTNTIDKLFTIQEGNRRAYPEFLEKGEEDQMTHKYLFLAGHGGEVFGHYLTAGKRSPEIPPGIFEGIYNREICSLVVPALIGSGIEAEFLNPGPYNIPQIERVNLVNDIHKRTGNQCILVVLHCNAARGQRVERCQRVPTVP